MDMIMARFRARHSVARSGGTVNHSASIQEMSDNQRRFTSMRADSVSYSSSICLMSLDAVARHGLQWVLSNSASFSTNNLAGMTNASLPAEVIRLNGFCAAQDIIVLCDLMLDESVPMTSYVFVLGLTDPEIDALVKGEQGVLLDDAQIYLCESIIVRGGPMTIVKVNRRLAEKYWKNSMLKISGNPEPGSALSDIVFTTSL